MAGSRSAPRVPLELNCRTVYSSEQFLGVSRAIICPASRRLRDLPRYFLERVGTDTEIEVSTARYFGDVLSRYAREN